jgi:hypothetical protein
MDNKINMNIPRDDYEKIMKEIESEDSPVGIDAKKTHIMILYQLMEMEKRITRIEKKLDDKR